MFDAFCNGLEGHFLGIWRGVEQTFFFKFVTFFYVFNFIRTFFTSAILATLLTVMRRRGVRQTIMIIRG